MEKQHKQNKTGNKPKISSSQSPHSTLIAYVGFIVWFWRGALGWPTPSWCAWTEEIERKQTEFHTTQAENGLWKTLQHTKSQFLELDRLDSSYSIFVTVHIQLRIKTIYPSPSPLISLRWTVVPDRQIITSLSSRPLLDENCVGRRLFVVFRMFQTECEQYD